MTRWSCFHRRQVTAAARRRGRCCPRLAKLYHLLVIFLDVLAEFGLPRSILPDGDYLTI